jgi:Rps23 Pro-64 3,4-dihydroxylase Tpa1-like proline 4-hydroxylase
MSHTRAEMAARICARLDAERTSIERQWTDAKEISHFFIDDLLPSPWANEIHSRFPAPSAMVLKRSLRELKCVTAKMNRYDSLLEESIYAFEAPGVVERIQQITKLRSLEPDELLYAGGISLMAPGQFLNPHVDNSHDKFRKRYRVLNLFYYVSPDCLESNGCNLELWPDGPKGSPTTIVSKFNRLVVMVTHRNSWHSVSKNVSRHNRCCVSNYYFFECPGGHERLFSCHELQRPAGAAGQGRRALRRHLVENRAAQGFRQGDKRESAFLQKVSFLQYRLRTDAKLRCAYASASPMTATGA